MVTETRASCGPRLGKLPLVRAPSNACCFRLSSATGSMLESRSSEVKKRRSGDRYSSVLNLRFGSADLNSSFRKQVELTKDSSPSAKGIVGSTLYFLPT